MNMDSRCWATAEHSVENIFRLPRKRILWILQCFLRVVRRENVVVILLPYHGNFPQVFLLFMQCKCYAKEAHNFFATKSLMLDTEF